MTLSFTSSIIRWTGDPHIQHFQYNTPLYHKTSRLKLLNKRLELVARCHCDKKYLFLLWESYPSYHNELFSLLLVLEILLPGGRSILVLSEQYETSYLFYVTLSFLCNIIFYLTSMFVFSLVTLSGATTVF